jgi:hypothetical protein
MRSDLSDDFQRFVIAGCLNRDTILPVSGPPQVDVLGGNLPYAAVGLNVWGQKSGLLAKKDQDFPMEWLDPFQEMGFDLGGIKTSPEPFDMRRFLAHEDDAKTHTQNPVQHFADRGLHFPMDLLGYNGEKAHPSSRTEPSDHAIKMSDIPVHFLEASAVHICPIDFISHMMLPSIFHQGQATTITLSPTPGYMSPSFWEEIPKLLSGITALIAQEQDVRGLFQGRQTDLWEMMGVLGDFGPEFIVVQTESWGNYLYDRIEYKRWIVPNYPVTVADPTGAEDAFAGGFLAGYRRDYDPLEAALKGSVSASLVVEGSGVFYATHAMPGLTDVRLEALRKLVNRV